MVTNSADIAVVPLRIGGGMRVKLLDFLSRGLPTIATSVGGEGVPSVYKGRATFRLADTPEEFVEQLVALCRSDVDRRELAEAGREMIVARFSWDNLIRGLLDWMRHGDTVDM